MNATSASSCLSCSSGQFQSASAQTECYDCEAGKYQNLDAEAFCRDCPVGYYSPAAATACLVCDAGYWFRGYNKLDESSAVSQSSLPRVFLSCFFFFSSLFFSFFNR